MGSIILTRTRIIAGHWEGIAHGTDATPPALQVHHGATPLGQAEVTAAEDGSWSVRVPIPPDLLSDGVTTFTISDAGSGETLDSFAVITGEALSDDIRAEMDLLRAELDMLKRAFRRHCVETAAGPSPD